MIIHFERKTVEFLPTSGLGNVAGRFVFVYRKHECLTIEIILLQANPPYSQC
jgi:hypothetical protein